MKRRITKDRLAKMLDHTYLKPDADEARIKALCEEAKALDTAMVAVNSAQTARCKKFLAGSGVHVGAAISFPLGQTTLAVKLFECEEAIKNGADEIDYVVNLTEVKRGNWDYVRQEMEEMTACCHAHGVICKVIFENCYLENGEIMCLSGIAKEVKPDFIKTSTGFGPGGATVEDVKLMKSIVGRKVKVKAAGGIRTYEEAMAMIEAGAERIGTSSSYQILRGYDRAHAD